MRKLTLLSGAALGATVAYLFDPDRGKTRRTRLIDQSAALRRKALARARAKLEYEKGVARGVVHEAGKPFREKEEVDDETLLQKIRSEALGKWQPSEENVEIDITDGNVTLRGSVGTLEDHNRLLELIESVDGVDSLDDRVQVIAR